MIIDFIDEKQMFLNDDIKGVIENAVRITLDYEKFSYIAEVSVMLTDNEHIRALNKKYRGIDKETDVLSFPCLELEALKYHRNDIPVCLGDIVISIQKAKQQAVEYGHSFNRELSFLVCHSVLHLLGYDHIHDHEKRLMFKKQEIILDGAGIVR